MGERMNTDRNAAVMMIAQAAAEAAIDAIIAEAVSASVKEAREEAVAAGIRAGIEIAPTAFRDIENLAKQNRDIWDLNK